MVSWIWIPVTISIMLMMGLMVLEYLGRKILAEDKERLEWLRAISATLARTNNHLDKTKSVTTEMRGDPSE